MSDQGIESLGWGNKSHCLGSRKHEWTRVNAGNGLIPEERSMDHSEFKGSSWSLAEARRGRLSSSLFQFSSSSSYRWPIIRKRKDHLRNIMRVFEKSTSPRETQNNDSPYIAIAGFKAHIRTGIKTAHGKPSQSTWPIHAAQLHTVLQQV